MGGGSRSAVRSGMQLPGATCPCGRGRGALVGGVGGVSEVALQGISLYLRRELPHPGACGQQRPVGQLPQDPRRVGRDGGDRGEARRRTPVRDLWHGVHGGGVVQRFDAGVLRRRIAVGDGALARVRNGVCRRGRYSVGGPCRGDCGGAGGTSGARDRSTEPGGCRPAGRLRRGRVRGGRPCGVVRVRCAGPFGVRR